MQQRRVDANTTSTATSQPLATESEPVLEPIQAELIDGDGVEPVGLSPLEAVLEATLGIPKTLNPAEAASFADDLSESELALEQISTQSAADAATSKFTDEFTEPTEQQAELTTETSLDSPRSDEFDLIIRKIEPEPSSPVYETLLNPFEVADQELKPELQEQPEPPASEDPEAESAEPALSSFQVVSDHIMPLRSVDLPSTDLSTAENETDRAETEIETGVEIDHADDDSLPDFLRLEQELSYLDEAPILAESADLPQDSTDTIDSFDMADGIFEAVPSPDSSQSNLSESSLLPEGSRETTTGAAESVPPSGQPGAASNLTISYPEANSEANNLASPLPASTVLSASTEIQSPSAASIERLKALLLQMPIQSDQTGQKRMAATGVSDQPLQQSDFVEPAESAPIEINAAKIASTTPSQPARRLRWTTPNLVLISAVGAFLCVSGLYALTRPCVIGSCEQLQQASKLSQEAIQTAQTTDSALEIVDAYKKLTEANYLLGTIPAWSRHHAAAQGLLASYENQSIVLKEVVAALEKANAAAQRSQNPPHPLPEWRRIQWLWRDAIAQLQRLSSESSLYPLVQRKLQEYQSNLTDINQRVEVEQQAQERINAVRQAGQLAEARANAAKSAENWQETAATWKTAIDQLQQIPQGTNAHNEAEQLLSLYQPKLSEANLRRAQEQAAAAAYSEALNAAEQAQRLEQQNQWSQAMAYWQDALRYAQQVPNGTAYYSQVQPLISVYTKTLQQAKDSTQRSAALQTLRPAMEQVCMGNPKICSYTISSQAVRVQFTSAYDLAVNHLIKNSQSQGESKFPSALVNQISELLRSLANLSETSQVPVELYDSKGLKLGSYAPAASGTAAQQ